MGTSGGAGSVIRLAAATAAAVILVAVTPALAALPRGYDVQRVDSPTPTIDGNFGIAFVNAGDVDGDREDDLLVGTDEHGGSDGQVIVLSGRTGRTIRIIPPPDSGGGGTPASFGSYVGRIADIGSCQGGQPGRTCPQSPIGGTDSVPDALVTALGVDVGAADIGRAYVIDGATGAVLKRIDMPPGDRSEQAGQKPAFGRTILSPASDFPRSAPNAVKIGDMDGGGRPDIVVGASDYFEAGPATNPACDPGPCDEAGRAYVYRGEDVAGSDPNAVLETPFKTIRNPTAQTDDLASPVNTGRESMGYSVAPVGDVGGCSADPGAGAACTKADSTTNPDGKADVVISSHRTDRFGMFDVGVALLVDGPTGSVLYTYQHPEPQPASIFAFTNYNQPAIGDVGNTTSPDVYLPAMRQNVRFTAQGRGYVMNGNFRLGGSPNSIQFAQLDDPTPHSTGNFGTSSAGIGDVAGDPRNEILVGAYGPHNPGTNEDVLNDVHIMTPLDEEPLLSLGDPDGQGGSGFGTAVQPMGDLNDDGFVDIAVGAGLYDGRKGADQGRVYLFRSDDSSPVRSRRVSLTRSGFVRVRVSCPGSQAGGCTGVLKLKTARKVGTRVGGRRKRVFKLGVRSFRVPGGRTGVVKVRVSRNAQAVLRRLRRVRIVATVTTREQTGKRRTDRRSLTLRTRPRR